MNLDLDMAAVLINNKTRVVFCDENEFDVWTASSATAAALVTLQNVSNHRSRRRRAVHVRTVEKRSTEGRARRGRSVGRSARRQKERRPAGGTGWPDRKASEII